MKNRLLQSGAIVLGFILTNGTASAQVASSDAAWCTVVEQALAGQGVQAQVRSDISGDNKIVHVTVGNETKRYVMPIASGKQDYSSPVYVVVDAFGYRASRSTFGRDVMDGRMWMGSRSSFYTPDEVFSTPADADALQADIRTTVSGVKRVALVDGEFTSTALSSGVPLLVMKGDIIAVQRGEQFKKTTPDQKGPRPIERWYAYAKVHVELTDYRTGEVVWTTDLYDNNYTTSRYTDPMDHVRQNICNSIRNKLTALYPSTAPRSSVQGKVLTVVEQKKDKAQKVHIDLGSANEVREGDTFTVYATLNVDGNSGSTPIGTLSVTEVQGRSLSLCKVKKGEKEILSALQQNATLLIRSSW